MALRKSTLATNATATPVVKTNPDELGQVRNFGTTYTITASDTTSDVVLLFPVPTNLAVRALLFSTDGAATAGAGNFGLYTLNAAGDTATAVDADLFASAQAITSALARSDITGESGVLTINERFAPLWEVVGASADPGGWYWVSYVPTTQADASTVVGVEAVGVL